MANSVMTTTLVFAVCLGVFLNGLRFSRMTKNPWADRTFFGLSIEGADMPIKKVQMIGRVQMAFAPFFFLFWILLSSGVLGPVEGF